MEFEWDERKRRINLAQHGVDFRDVALMFRHPVMEAEDTRTEYGERRFRALGRLDGAYFLVAYTWREDRRRLISAWRVDDDGGRRYETILRRDA